MISQAPVPACSVSRAGCVDVVASGNGDVPPLLLVSVTEKYGTGGSPGVETAAESDT